MARIKTPRIIGIEFTEGPNEGLNIRIKSVKFGRVRRLIALMDSEDKDVEIMDEMSSLLADALVSWDLQEEDGSPVEPNLEAIDDLEFDEVIDIINRWLDNITGPERELGKDSNSGVKFPGRPLTMEAL